MSKLDKYLNEFGRGLEIFGGDSSRANELVKLSKQFITDMKIISGKYDFELLEDVTRRFLKKYINDLNKIYKKL